MDIKTAPGREPDYVLTPEGVLYPTGELVPWRRICSRCYAHPAEGPGPCVVCSATADLEGETTADLEELPPEALGTVQELRKSTLSLRKYDSAK